MQKAVAFMGQKNKVELPSDYNWDCDKNSIVLIFNHSIT